ncbi:hypothetical protein PINS_up015061 [Pythium insidiosum]|nr:hypothetical protein PINS_up015061 [Pythium insidiosum]
MRRRTRERPRRRQRRGAACALWLALVAVGAAIVLSDSVVGLTLRSANDTTTVDHTRRNASDASNDTSVGEYRRHKVHVATRVASYRNAYGTRFECSSTCYFITAAHLASVVAGLALLSVIPVRTPVKKPEEAPCLTSDLDKPSAPGDVGVGDVSVPGRRGLWRRIWAQLWGIDDDPMAQATVKLDSKEELQKHFHEDVDIVSEQAANKTFESIGVETDDFLLHGLLRSERLVASNDDCVIVDDPDRLFDPLPERRTIGRGIFSPAQPPSPKQHVKAADTETRRGSVVGMAGPGERRGSLLSVGSRRGSLLGLVGGPQTPKESLLQAVERRQSMQKRAEKRKEYARSDINHEDLDDRELETYEYLEFVRELLEGMTVRKICQKSAKAVKRTFYMTPDLTTIYWNQVGNRTWVNKKSSVDTASITKVVKGIRGNPNLEAKGKQEKEMLYVSIETEDGRRLDLETKDEKMRQRMYLGFSKLAQEKREEKRRREAGIVEDEAQEKENEAHQAVAEEKMGRTRQQESPVQAEREEKEDDRTANQRDDETNQDEREHPEKIAAVEDSGEEK